MTLDEVRRRFDEHNVRRVKLGTFDIDTTLRGKYISLDKFWPAVESGLGFCDVIFGWDIGDVLYDNVKFTGWHTGYPDAQCRIDLDTLRLLPWEPGTAFFLMDMEAPVAPRNVLRRVLERAAELGYQLHSSVEYEFFLFKETAQTLREKGFRNLTTLSPGMFGYSVLRASANSELVLRIIDELAAFDVPLEGFHTETGPGVYEAAIAVEEGIRSADRAALFKTAVKEIACRHGVTPTFMAKWSMDLPGSSGHIHQSLWSGEQNAFFAEAGMSPLMEHYVAGLVAHLPDMAALVCPTVNSYKRTVPGAWAPVNSTWGLDNRTTAVRAIPGRKKSTRVELRLAGADINPYIATAASVAAGLDGIERKLPLPPATVNAYSADGAAPLPRNLAEATRRLRESRIARCWLGDQFIDHYCATREWEVRQFEKAVTDWELARYFEAI